MFINRQLQISLLISFLWHLFWMSFVSIVFLPSGFKPRQYCSVYFFGSILRRPIFGQATLSRKGEFAEFPSEVDIQMDRSHFTQLLRQEAGLNERPYISLPAERKIPNPDDFIDVDTLTQEQSFAASFASAKGPTPVRKIVFQPPFPKYHEWTQQELKGSCVIFNIIVSADGLVEQIINTQASGNPEIDAALARYIERWRFARISGLQGQWQTVKINLDFDDGSASLIINPQSLGCVEDGSEISEIAEVQSLRIE